MKKLVGIIILVLMVTTMICPVFGESEKILEEEKLEETYIEEVKCYEKWLIIENGKEIIRTITTDGVITDEYDTDDGHWVVTYGNTPYMDIQFTRKSRVLTAIENGWNFVTTKCKNGCNHVKSWFVRDGKNE